MDISHLEELWNKAILDLLGESLDPTKVNVLARQTQDSIRRIKIYESYKQKAYAAVNSGQPLYYTTNPFILAQRSDLGNQDKAWIIYLATYFGKSNSSKWELFKRATFRNDLTYINFDIVINDLHSYFNYLLGIDFFKDCTYSNHRKFTAKALIGPKGLFRSIEFFIKNIDRFCPNSKMDFHEMFVLSMKIPNFGRLAGFDFSSSLAKIGLINEPQSMYADHSTGPLKGLELLLRLTSNNASRINQRKLGKDLMVWFLHNSNIFMVGQVLEDSICNWQKETGRYIYYSG